MRLMDREDARFLLAVFGAIVAVVVTAFGITFAPLVTGVVGAVVVTFGLAYLVISAIAGPR